MDVHPSYEEKNNAILDPSAENYIAFMRIFLFKLK